MIEDVIDVFDDASMSLGWTRHEMYSVLGIPEETIASWDAGTSSCPEWVARLVLDKLKSIEASRASEPINFTKIDKKIKELCPDAFAAYAVIDTADEYVLIVPSEEEAVMEARSQWDCLTESEKKGRTITAGIVAGYLTEVGAEAYPELENGDILRDVYEVLVEFNK
jgi:hypothetical protein